MIAAFGSLTNAEPLALLESVMVRGSVLGSALARVLGGELRSLHAIAPFYVHVVAVRSRCLLLLRDFSSDVVVSLPTEHSWVVSTEDDSATVTEICRATEQYATRLPDLVSLCDVLGWIQPELERQAGSPWPVQFPSDLVPTSLTLDHARRRMILSQVGSGVEVAVRVRDKLVTRGAFALVEREQLTAWLERQMTRESERLAKQDRAFEQEQASARALAQGLLDEVLRALEAGATFRIAWGRGSTTYRSEAGQLVCEELDEGRLDIRTIDQAALLEAMARHPDAFAPGKDKP